MKRRMMGAGIALLLLLCACTPKESTSEPVPSAQPEQDVTPPVYALQPEVRVDQTVAVVQADTANTCVLYGAASYTNTGNCPIRIIGASFAYTLSNDITVNNSFTPIFSDNDIVAPGESGYLALWHSYGKALEAGQTLALSAELQAVAADTVPFPLEVRHTSIAQNYPGFATVSGSIYNMQKQDCTLNMIYLAFFDQQDKLLGVFHFTEDGMIPSGEFRNFVMHLRALPLDQLAEKTVTIRAHAFGME